MTLAPLTAFLLRLSWWKARLTFPSQRTSSRLPWIKSILGSETWRGCVSMPQRPSLSLPVGDFPLLAPQPLLLRMLRGRQFKNANDTPASSLSSLSSAAPDLCHLSDSGPAQTQETVSPQHLPVISCLLLFNCSKSLSSFHYLIDARALLYR